MLLSPLWLCLSELSKVVPLTLNVLQANATKVNANQFHPFSHHQSAHSIFNNALNAQTKTHVQIREKHALGVAVEGQPSLILSQKMKPLELQRFKHAPQHKTVMLLTSVDKMAYVTHYPHSLKIQSCVPSQLTAHPVQDVNLEFATLPLLLPANLTMIAQKT